MLYLIDLLQVHKTQHLSITYEQALLTNLSIILQYCNTSNLVTVLSSLVMENPTPFHMIAL